MVVLFSLRWGYAYHFGIGGGEAGHGRFHTSIVVVAIVLLLLLLLLGEWDGGLRFVPVFMMIDTLFRLACVCGG